MNPFTPEFEVKSFYFEHDPGCQSKSRTKRQMVSHLDLHYLVGVGVGGEGGNLGIILVRVCVPVFGNLPHSYTWPLKKNGPIHILDHMKC